MCSWGGEGGEKVSEDAAKPASESSPHHYFFPPSSNVNESIYTPYIERVEDLTEKEVDLVMYNLKKEARKRSGTILILPTSLPPPPIGKILERLFQFSCSKHLADDNVIQENQFGSREGRSCEGAVNNIISKIRENKETKHCAVISLDIKSAFNSMDWSILFTIFESYDISDFYKNFIFHYLIDRKVVFVDETVNTERQFFMGCPQGSVIPLGIWNIYFNKILELDNEEFFVQAFADDLALVTTGRNRRKLVDNTNRLLALISDKLEELKLNFSVDKVPGNSN
ncbi:hypothetical protein AVEN_147235-1 [Araneus ventricosus]|uniref:Reverse transcriptase domain-containing protein n=1 Tax=Araneus ventricosus TaxID=182803 RepID=A0A4Y2PWI6_ARAVE|nr:hypothetical protein AVEN_147235-1 [Araneus ventricosus]